MATKHFCDLCGTEITGLPTYRIVVDFAGMTERDEPLPHSSPGTMGPAVVGMACRGCAVNALSGVPNAVTDKEPQ